MSELSEKDLLLLSNYLYIDECTSYSSVGELLDVCRNTSGEIDAGRVEALGIGGAMSVEECADLLQEIDTSNDYLKDLYASRVINDGGIRAIAFTSDEAPDSATVVFRGTGGEYDAWADNVKGEYMSETTMQKLADDFIKYDCGIYTNITTSGHSKGCNLAEHVTITNGDRVSRCIGFDGQGFGKSYIREHVEEIAENSSKIKTINAYNDYVNILLTSVAGEKVFVDNRADGLMSHSSYELLKSCKYDENGNITNFRGQQASKALLEDVLGLTVDTMDFLPGDGNKYTSNVLAAAVAGLLSNDKDESYENSELSRNFNGLGKYVLSLYGINNNTGTPSLVADELYVDTNALKSATCIMNEVIRDIDENIDLICDVKTRLNYRAASRLAVDILLNHVEEKLIKNKKRVECYKSTLEKVINLYADCESELATALYS